MKVGTRVVFTIFMVLMILLLLFLLLSTAGLLPGTYMTTSVAVLLAGMVWVRVLIGVALGVLVAVAVSLIFFGSKNRKNKTALLASFDTGSISVSLSAIEELAVRYVKNTEAVKAVAVKVHSAAPDQISLDVHISVLPDISIPDVTRTLQSGLLAYIEKTTGIVAKSVVVLVSSISETIGVQKTGGGI